MTFDEFEVDPRCLSVLKAQELSTPTAVQERAIPAMLCGSDLIVTAQTGSGKTLAYSLPALTRLAQEQPRRSRMLVLVPTRELAVQVEGVMKPFAKALQLRLALIYGGVGFNTQNSQLKTGSDIIVATPGRLLDHMGRGNVRLGQLEILVFDEADRMLDMGFLPDIKRIVEKLPVNRQTAMFSATFAPEVERLSANMMRNPERIEIGVQARPVETVRQLLIPVRPEQKSQVLQQILQDEHIDSGILFLRTKERTDRLAKLLKKMGYNAAPIHGDLPQQNRAKALEGFRSGKHQLLVATDVAARGLDIDDISHVINYDIPLNPDDYIHRIGRTARAAKEGDAWTFVTPSEHQALAAIERALGSNLPRKEYEGAPPVLSTWHPPGFRPTAPRRVMRGLLRRRR